MVSVYIAVLLLISLINYISSKPLTQEVLDYLHTDQETFYYYKREYKLLCCKLITYGRIKYFYEMEEIDPFMNKTDNKRGFLDFLQTTLYDNCVEKYSDFNMEIFEPKHYAQWDNELTKWVDLDLNSIFANFTQLNKKEDL